MSVALVHSMTGFGRGVTQTETFQITMEIRSVNHRYIEMTTNFPRDWMEAEITTKKIVADKIARGKVDISVNIRKNDMVEQTFQVNWALVNAYREARQQLSAEIPLAAEWTMQELLQLQNVVVQNSDEPTIEELIDAIRIVAKEATQSLVQMREREGQQLLIVMEQFIEQLQEQLKIIHQASPLAVEKYRQRLTERIAEITEMNVIDSRIMTEVALFAERADISEELHRLDSHVIQLKETLQLNTAIGRKLDFIMQEMNRETNTIGAKNQSSEAAIAIIEAKTIIEKMREQIQNIE